MYDLQNEYDAWLDRLPALNAETSDAPTPPAAPRGKPYTRPADDAERMAVTLARIAFAPKFAHRSHRHQRGEES